MEDPSTTTIEKAYDDLSQQAFAVWIRLAVTTNKELIDRKTISKVLRYSLSQTNVVLTELRRKGYIKLESRANPGRRSKFIFRKRTIISGETRFINLIGKNQLQESANDRLSRTSEKKVVKNEKNTKNKQKSKKKTKIEENRFNNEISVNLKKNGPSKIPGFIPERKLFFEQLSGLEKLSDFFEDDEPPKNKGPKKKKSVSDVENNISKKSSNLKVKSKEKSTKKPREKSIIPGGLGSSVISENDNPNINSQKRGFITSISSYSLKDKKKLDKKSKFKVKQEQQQQKKNKDKIKSNKTNKIDLDKLKSKVKQEKDKRKIREKSKLSCNPNSFDWNRINQDNCKFDFEMSDNKKDKVIEILERNKKDKERKSLVANIGLEFADIYTRYRRLVQENKGNKRNFKIYKDELKHAQKAGEYCVLKGVAPIDLLKYWHDNISDFANANLKVPPLSFLSSPANIETVVCSSDKVELNESAEVGAHSFSDVSKLHPKVRSGLTSAGIDVQEHSDRFLLTAQIAAESIAGGHQLYMSSHLRKMATWIAENLYRREA